MTPENDKRRRAGHYAQDELRMFARWLGYSGCPHADDAIKMAVDRRLDLDKLLRAWETRIHAREKFIRLEDLHDLDEFDTIIEELLIEHEYRPRD